MRRISNSHPSHNMWEYPKNDNLICVRMVSLCSRAYLSNPMLQSIWMQMCRDTDHDGFFMLPQYQSIPCELPALTAWTKWIRIIKHASPTPRSFMQKGVVRGITPRRVSWQYPTVNLRFTAGCFAFSFSFVFFSLLLTNKGNVENLHFGNCVCRCRTFDYVDDSSHSRYQS